MVCVREWFTVVVDLTCRTGGLSGLHSLEMPLHLRDNTDSSRTFHIMCTMHAMSNQLRTAPPESERHAATGNGRHLRGQACVCVCVCVCRHACVCVYVCVRARARVSCA